jgi:HK97 family phage portal protein
MRLPFSKKIHDWYTGANVKNRALDLGDDKLYEAMQDVGSVSNCGISVTEESAMKFSAVYSCVSLLAGLLASLPFKVITTENGYEESVESSRLLPLLNQQPSSTMTAFVFWETIGLNLFLSGNAYAIISRTKLGDPKALIWVPSQFVTPRFNSNKTRIIYTISADDKGASYDQDDILHFPCIGWNGLKGMSPITAATEGIGLGLAGEKYNSHFFTNAVTSDIAISYDKPMTPEAQSALEKYLSNRYSNVDNLRKPFIGTNGAKITNLGLSASDAQLIEGRDYQVEDICRFYGIPPWLVGAMKKTTSWGTGLSEQTLGFVKFTWRKHAKRVEQELDRKLVRHPKRRCKQNLDSLLRADIKTRYDSYKVALGGNQVPGFLSVNMVLKIEGLPPINDPRYDKPYMPIDGTTTEETTETGTDEE